MLGTLTALTLFTWGFAALPAWTDKVWARRGKTLPAWGIMFLLYLATAYVLFECFLFRLQTAALSPSLSAFFGSSGHFIISLDIMSLFAALILVIYHSFKLPYPSLAR